MKGANATRVASTVGKLGAETKESRAKVRNRKQNKLSYHTGSIFVIRRFKVAFQLST